MERYRKNGIIKYRNEIMINDNGYNIINPSEELLIKNGWEIYVQPVIEEVPFELSRDEKIVNLIRERYTIDDEFSILRQRDTKPDEFNEYFNYCEECKSKVKAIM